MKNYQIENKVIVFSADNAPTNFGSIHRTGDKNVFKQLKEKVNPHMIGAGCVAHIVHNAIESACDQLSIDVEYVAVKIYTHFYRYTVRLESLKHFCDSVDEIYVNLVGLNAIIANFNGLQEYFKSINAPVGITEFFANPLAKVSMIFVRDQAENFQKTILKIEGDDLCAIDIASAMNHLQTNVESRLQNNFISNDHREEMENIRVQHARKKSQFVESTKAFHQTALNYLKERTKWLEDVIAFNWVGLNSGLNWEVVEKSVQWMIERNYFDAKKMDNVFDQFAQLDVFLKTAPASSPENRSTVTKWVEIFTYFREKSLPYEDLAKVVEFALTLPGTNASIERVFSNINDIWTPDKGSLLIENVRARLMVKYNWKKDCSDFYKEIINNKKLLQKVRQSEK